MTSPERPILLRLIVPFLAITVLIVTVTVAVTYWSGQRAVRAQQYRDLDRLTALVRNWVAGTGGELTPVEADQIRSAAEVLDTRITLIGGDGAVLFDSHADASSMENHNARPEVVAARRNEVGTRVRYSDTIDEDSIYLASLLDPSRPQGVVVRLSYPRHAWPALGAPLWAVLLAGIGATTIATLIVGRILWRDWLAPTSALAAAADRMAGGDWSPRVEPQGADEMRAFSQRLNTVADNAGRQVNELRQQRGDLQAILDTLPDPLLVTDDHGRLRQMNAPAERLLEITSSEALGREIGAVINDQALLELLELSAAGASIADAANTDGMIGREIRLHRDGQRRHFQAMATRTSGGGMLLVLRDVTELATAMQMKTDFVANASHELRTPIAALKVAFETLTDVYADDPEQTVRCIRIMEEHLRRLEEMLRDLLDLSKVENPELRPHLADVRAADVLAVLRSTMGPFARQKNVELQLVEQGIDGEPLRFVSDERLLQLVLKNLVENSIKFTPSGGRVTVTLRHEDDALVASVADTGIGIPPEHLDRVFERFYQVNTARTGSAGRGTGLGLAIVKHAVAALGGTVHLDSTPGHGTTAVCTLPSTVDASL